MSKSSNRVSSNLIWIYGKHPVISAIKNQKRNKTNLLVTEQSLQYIKKSVPNIEKICPITVTSRQYLSQKFPGSNHQGVAIEVSTVFNTEKLSDVITKNKNNKKNVIVMLDSITDPQNIGAIARSAAAFNVRAILITSHNSPSETNILAKSAAGALELVPIIQINNLNNAIKTLKNNNYWVVGLDASKSKKDITQIKNFDNIVIVMGSEKDGIKDLVKKNCDTIVNIKISDKMESLNVSAATAIVLYIVNS